MKDGKRIRPPIEKVGGLETAKERREIVRMLVRMFTKAPPPGIRKHILNAIWAGPVFNPEHTRLVAADGRVVSFVVMAPRMMRFGPVSVPAMTVGPLGTHEDYRKLGYNAVAMNDSAAYMKKHGVLLAYLSGIRRYYWQFGYYPYAANSSVRIQTDEAARIMAPGRLRKMMRRDIPAVSRLYDEAVRGSIGPAARDRTVWDWLVTQGAKTWLFPRPMLILDGGGRLCGYLTRGARGGPGISEIVVQCGEKSWRAALGALVRDARKHKLEEICLPLNWGEPMTVFLRQHAQASYDIKSKPDGSKLLAIMDFPRLMRALEPMFTERWNRARPPSAPCRFTIASEIGSVSVSVSGRAVKTGGQPRGPRVRVPVCWLPGLITGYYSVDDIAERKGVKIPTPVRPVLDILFPAGWPTTLRADNY